MPEISLEVSKEILNEIIASSKQILTIYKLGNTDLIDSIEWVYRDDAFILLANNYFQNVNYGRRPMVKKIPIEALLKWIRKKNIRPREGHTINSMAYVIQNSIYKSGIRARKFIDPIIGMTLDELSEYIAEELSVTICDQLAEDLTITLKN